MAEGFPGERYVTVPCYEYEGALDPGPYVQEPFMKVISTHVDYCDALPHFKRRQREEVILREEKSVTDEQHSFLKAYLHISRK